MPETPRIKAVVQPPTITLAYTRNGNPAGSVQLTPGPVEHERDAPGWPEDSWEAVASWGSGSATAAVSTSEGDGSGGGNGSGSGSGGN